ncbi:hypothetical protein U1Q18_038269 [Sarracenia purpurea var. burkii]
MRSFGGVEQNDGDPERWRFGSHSLSSEIQNGGADGGHGRRSFGGARSRKRIGIRMRIGMVHPNVLQRTEKVGLVGTFRVTSKQRKTERE